jgi:hypothetical protein
MGRILKPEVPFVQSAEDVMLAATLRVSCVKASPSSSAVETSIPVPATTASEILHRP